MKNISVYLTMFMFCAVNYSSAQDIHFSQFYMAPLTVNPAAAGANYDMQAIINYKDQWRNVDSPYKTFAMSYDMRLMPANSKGGFLAAGINFNNDLAGSARMGTTSAALSLTYHVRLAEYQTLGLGIQSGMLQRNVDVTYLSWGEQYDGSAYNPAMNNGEASLATGAFTKFDMGTGLLWTYDNTNGVRNKFGNSDLKINVGFSVQHLTQPKLSFSGSDEKLYMRYTAHSSAVIGISDSRFAIVPGIMYYRQGPAQEFYIGSLFRCVTSLSTEYVKREGGSAIYLGCYYRAGDAVSTHLLIDYAQFTFGMSYDINISDLKVGSNGRGGLELSIAFVGSNIFNKTSGASSID